MSDLMAYVTCVESVGGSGGGGGGGGGWQIRERGFCASFPLPSPFLLLPRRLMPDEILPAVPSDDCMDRSDAYA